MSLHLTSYLCRMPLAISRIGRLDLIDEQLFYLAARDFYSQLGYSESHRQAFTNTFQSVAASDTPYANILTFCGGGSMHWIGTPMPTHLTLGGRCPVSSVQFSGQIIWRFSVCEHVMAVQRSLRLQFWAAFKEADEKTGKSRPTWVPIIWVVLQFILLLCFSTFLVS